MLNNIIGRIFHDSDIKVCDINYEGLTLTNTVSEYPYCKIMSWESFAFHKHNLEYGNYLDSESWFKNE